MELKYSACLACYKLVGTEALATIGTDNWFIGNSGITGTFPANSNAKDNVCIGNNAGANTYNGVGCIFIGANAGEYTTGGTNDICIGINAGKANGSYWNSHNILIGESSGSSIYQGSYNTCIGPNTGQNLSNGTFNVFIGGWAGAPTDVNSTLWIDSYGGSNGTALIYGDFTNRRVAINQGSASYNLDVGGSIRGTSPVWTSSDIRWKENVTTLSNPIEKILRLRGVEFTWKRKEFKNKNFPEGKQIGVIAQEMEKEFPELVSTDNEGYKNVSYEALTPILLEAVKAQQQEIQALKVEVEKLKKPAN